MADPFRMVAKDSKACPTCQQPLSGCTSLSTLMRLRDTQAAINEAQQARATQGLDKGNMSKQAQGLDSPEVKTGDCSRLAGCSPQTKNDAQSNVSVADCSEGTPAKEVESKKRQTIKLRKARVLPPNPFLADLAERRVTIVVKVAIRTYHVTGKQALGGIMQDISDGLGTEKRQLKFFSLGRKFGKAERRVRRPTPGQTPDELDMEDHAVLNVFDKEACSDLADMTLFLE